MEGEVGWTREAQGEEAALGSDLVGDFMTFADIIVVDNLCEIRRERDYYIILLWDAFYYRK